VDVAPLKYPRVEDLTYRVEMGVGHALQDDASVEGQLRGFRYKLAKDTAYFFPLNHYETEAEARAALQPQIDAWEIDCALRIGPAAMTFKYMTSYVQSEAPRSGVAQLRGVVAMCFAANVSVLITHAKHPAPPIDFAANDLVKDLAAQFMHARGNPASLLKDAYSMVTRLEFEFGGPAAAATALRISRTMLGEVRKLSTGRGTGAEVRKFKTSVKRTPLLAGEREWLMRALELIVRRAGADAAGIQFGEEVTLATMPIPKG